MLTFKDDGSKGAMCYTAREDAGKILLLDPAERRTKAVLVKYRLDLPLEVVYDHRHVLTAERLRTTRNKAPTRRRDLT